MLEPIIRAYFQAVQEKDAAGSTEFLHPSLWQFIPKDFLIKQMQEMFDDEETAVNMTKFDLIKLSEPFVFWGKSYVLADYHFTMEMPHAIDPENPIPEEDPRESIDFEPVIAAEEEEIDLDDEEIEESGLHPFDEILQMQEAVFGVENVSADREKGIIRVYCERKLLVIKENEAIGWRILEFKEQMKPLLEQILPQEVMARFGA